jgi:hypothetical protein
MSEDIVERLRSLRHIHLPQLSEEAAAEIESLRVAVAAYTSGISAGVDSKPTLTDEERAAVTWYAAYGAGDHAATLCALLSRTGSDSRQTCDEAAECHSHGEKLPERDRITEAERWALKYFAAFDRSPRERDAAAAATLRELLERLA